jgi:hypothetical protein
MSDSPLEPSSTQQPPNSPDTINVVLSNTLSNQEWDLSPPLSVQTHVLLKKIVQETHARERDDNGLPIPYRLMWTEGDRYLMESETLKQAGVLDGHHLILAYEPRAGV